ncbi:hypothetical protein KAI87_14950, partial [Myxococcota bacterium]|nr:hypothetical protein [Myxococcota bacterium]
MLLRTLAVFFMFLIFNLGSALAQSEEPVPATPAPPTPPAALPPPAPAQASFGVQDPKQDSNQDD